MAKISSKKRPVGTVNKNSVPNDPASPFVTSGIRIGTPAVTTRGFKEKEIIQVSNWICEIARWFMGRHVPAPSLKI